jgi:zinc transporter ZupT
MHEQEDSLACQEAYDPAVSSSLHSADEPLIQDAEKQSINWSIIVGILIGDGIHNFVDGVAIGAAFKRCSVSLGWSTAGAALGHELTQELGDFLILTNQGGLPVMKALLVNFASAPPCVLGTLVVYATDPDSSSLGCMLGFGGGTYLYLATVPTVPKLTTLTTGSDMAIHFILFVLGATAICLVLLDHEHCGEDCHDHHAH